MYMKLVGKVYQDAQPTRNGGVVAHITELKNRHDIENNKPDVWISCFSTQDTKDPLMELGKANQLIRVSGYYSDGIRQVASGEHKISRNLSVTEIEFFQKQESSQVAEETNSQDQP